MFKKRAREYETETLRDAINRTSSKDCLDELLKKWKMHDRFFYSYVDTLYNGFYAAAKDEIFHLDEAPPFHIMLREGKKYLPIVHPFLAIGANCLKNYGAIGRQFTKYHDGRNLDNLNEEYNSPWEFCKKNKIQQVFIVSLASIHFEIFLKSCPKELSAFKNLPTFMEMVGGDSSDQYADIISPFTNLTICVLRLHPSVKEMYEVTHGRKWNVNG